MNKRNYEPGEGSVINVCSPVMDMTTADVWRLFAATDFQVSDIYEKMHQAGIAIENQRTGSLLNFAATKNIATIKTLEPDMYAKINARFQNIEFMAQFGKSGYYNIGKPKDVDWNGRNHIKAGMSNEECTFVSDLYEKTLSIHKVEFDRVGNEFKFPKDPDNPIMTPDKPLKDLSDSGVEVVADKGMSADEREEYIDTGYLLESMVTIHTTWEDYCLYMLNTTSEPIKSIWREKMITSILSWKFSTGSIEESTLDAIKVLSELDGQFTESITDDQWEFEDWNRSGQLGISGKHVFSISRYPQESLEKEVLMCIEDIVERKDLDALRSSPKLWELVEMWNEQGGKSLTPLEFMQNYIGKEEKKVIPVIEQPVDIGTDRFWKNVSNAAKIWFKENIHSTSSWKRFAIAILKNDVGLKYLGFAPTSSERMARAKAMSAFSTKQDEKEKAKKEAERLAKKIEKENR